MYPTLTSLVNAISANKPTAIDWCDTVCLSIGNKGFRRIAGALSHNTSLTSLNLTSARIGAPVSRIFNLMRDNRTLRTLKVRPEAGYGITPDQLGDLLLHNRTLTDLDIGTYNPNIKYDGPASSHPLALNSTLLSLNLGTIVSPCPYPDLTPFPPDNMIQICQALAFNSTLLSLSLNADTLPMGDLCRSLILNSTLTTLDIALYMFDDGASFAQMLVQNTTLTSLQLHGRAANASILDQALGLDYNTTLKHIGLDFLDLGYIIRPDWGGGLIHLIRSNTGLNSISAPRMIIYPDRALQLLQALEHNMTLTHLDVDWSLEGTSFWHDGTLRSGLPHCNGIRTRVAAQLQRNKDNQIKRSQSLYEILFIPLLL